MPNQQEEIVVARGTTPAVDKNITVNYHDVEVEKYGHCELKNIDGKEVISKKGIIVGAVAQDDGENISLVFMFNSDIDKKYHMFAEPCVPRIPSKFYNEIYNLFGVEITIDVAVSEGEFGHIGEAYNIKPV